ncbi:hypothetical protein BTHI11S_04471 [Bosea thiooxidans]
MDEQRVAVRVGRCQALGPGGAARARHVLDDDLLAERATHMVAEQPCDHVTRPARRKRHDQGQGLRRKILRRIAGPANPNANNPVNTTRLTVFTIICFLRA